MSQQIGIERLIEPPGCVHYRPPSPVGNVALRLPTVHGLDGIAGFAGDDRGLTQGVEDAVNDVHEASYPINGYLAQVPYPILSEAGILRLCQKPNMAFALPDEPAFDIDLVRERMKEMRVSQVALAEEMGLNQSAISNILKGQRQVKVHEASFIYRRLKLEPEARIKFVPAIGLSSAGNWREAVQMPGRSVAVPIGIGGTRAFAVELQGDSMDKLIPEGGYVVVDPDETRLNNGRVYLIENDDHETQVKLYRSDPARFEPRSFNDSHQPVYLDEHRVRVIGRVIWQGSPL